MKSFLNHRSYYIIIPFLFIFLITCTKKEDPKVDSTSKTEFVLNEDSLSSPVYVAKYVVFKEQIEKYDEDEGDLNFDHIVLKDGIMATNITNYFPPAEIFYLWRMKNGKIEVIHSVFNSPTSAAEYFSIKDLNKDEIFDLVVSGPNGVGTPFTDIYIQSKHKNDERKFTKAATYNEITPLFLDLNNDSVVDIIEANSSSIYFPLDYANFNELINADWEFLKKYQKTHTFLELGTDYLNYTTPLLTFYPIKIHTINTKINYIQDVTLRYPEILKMHLKCLLSARFKNNVEDNKTLKAIKIHTKYMIQNINSRLEYATDTNFLPIFEKELEEKRRLELESYESF